jgi:protoporphyrinogen oxidase
MRAIPYRGIVCVLLELSRPLSPYYWVNVTDRLGLGCVGIIEHTNFIPPERYGGRTLVYLAHYVDRDGPTWSATPEQLVEAVIPAMHALNPAFERDWIVDIHVNRDPFAQPVPKVGGPMPTLTVDTGLPGLYHASLAHVYPDDRGVSKALALGRRAARLVAQAHPASSA